MAETGSMVKVSGRSSDTPLGAPRPGRTPDEDSQQDADDHQRNVIGRQRDAETVHESDAKFSTACPLRRL